MAGETPTDAGTVDPSASPDQQFLYVQTGANGIVDEFRLDLGGSLTSLGSAPCRVPPAVRESPPSEYGLLLVRATVEQSPSSRFSRKDEWVAVEIIPKRVDTTAADSYISTYARRSGRRGFVTTTHSPELAVVTTGLTKEFGDRRAVDSLDLTIPRGTVCGFVGPNGVVKTTTTRNRCRLVGCSCLGTLRQPTAPN